MGLGASELTGLGSVKTGAGADAGGNGSGTITSIASAGNTIQVTSPTGPAVNVEAKLPATEIAVGTGGGLVGSTSHLTYNADSDGAVNNTVDGRPLATWSWFKGILSNLTATADGAFSFFRNGTRFASLSVRQAGTGAAPTANTVQVRFDVAAGRLSTFRVGADDDVHGSNPLVVDATHLDAYSGSDVELAAAATAGFAWGPTIAADPTGTPAAAAIPGTAQAPRVFDPHTGKVWEYSFPLGAWIQTGGPVVGANFKDALWAFMKSRYGTLRDMYYEDLLDPVDASTYDRVLGGISGAETATTSAGAGGVRVLSAGTGAAVGNVAIYPKGNGSPASTGFLQNGRSTVWFTGALINIISHDSHGTAIVGAENPGTSALAYWGAIGTASTTKLAYYNGSSVATAFNIPVGPTALVIANDGTTVTFFFGNPQTGTMAVGATVLATTLPAGLNPFVPTAIVNADGAGGVEAMSVDAIFAGWA